MLIREFFATFGVGLVAVIAMRLIATRLRRPKYLPGPPRLPFIGNLFQMPESEAWVTYRKWAEIYGTHSTPIRIYGFLVTLFE